MKENSQPKIDISQFESNLIPDSSKFAVKYNVGLTTKIIFATIFGLTLVITTVGITIGLFSKQSLILHMGSFFDKF